MAITSLEWFDEAHDPSGSSRTERRADLVAYFATSEGVPEYSGSRFESFGDNPPNRIVVDDLVAVSMLSVRVPGQAALRFLERAAGAISDELVRIPLDRDLHEACEEDIDRDSAVWKLWDILRTRKRPDGVGVGPVTTSKLLARKRPRLLPVYDEIVRNELGIQDSMAHWTEVREFLRAEPGRVALLQDLAAEARIPHTVSILRVFDVLLWMHGKSAKARRKQQDPKSE